MWPKILTGGRVFRSKPQFILENHLCCFTSLAPLLLPNLVHSFLSSNRVMQSFPALHSFLLDLGGNSAATKNRNYTYRDTLGESRKCTGSSRMLSNVSFRSWPLNGVVAYYRHPPKPYLARRLMCGCAVGTHHHLVNENSQCPPVHGSGMAFRTNHLWRNIFCPKDHQTSIHCQPRLPPLPSVPTNELVRKCAVHDIVSTNGTWIWQAEFR